MLVVTHNVRRYKFALPSPEHVLGLQTGQCLYLCTELDDTPIVRAYTPVTYDEQHRGYFELVFKVYFKGVNPAHPAGGKMTQYLESLAVGAEVDVRGPSGMLVYYGGGRVGVRPDRKSPPAERHVKQLALVAGGSGITPMLQVVEHVLADAADPTLLSLLFSNTTEDDIIMRNELEALQAKHPTRFKLWHTVSRPKPGWKYSTGHVTKEMLREHLPAPSASGEVLALVCGPPGFVKESCVPMLSAIGFRKEDIFVF